MKKNLQYNKVTSRYYLFIVLNFNSFNISFVAILDHSNLDDINYTPFIGLLIYQEFLWENANQTSLKHTEKQTQIEHMFMINAFVCFICITSIFTNPKCFISVHFLFLDFYHIFTLHGHKSIFCSLSPTKSIYHKGNTLFFQ